MSLLAKVSKGSGFRGLFNYLRDGKPNEPRIPPGEILGGNLSGQDPRALAAELATVRRLRPDCKRPVLHVSLSLPAGLDLTPDQWRQAAATWMEQMGIDAGRHPYVLYQHTETDHQHVHLVVSRIAIDGTLTREARGDFKLAHKAAAAASLAVGLQPQPKPAAEHRQPRVTKHDRREIEEGATPARLAIAARFDEALAQATSWQDVKTRAAALGMEIQEATNAGGVYGIKCRLAGGEWIKGSQIGKAYTYNSILKRLQAGGADIAHGPTGKPRRDILNRLQAEKTASGTVYRWASGHVAVIDLGNSLQWRTGSAAEAAALAAVAKAKGWQSVQMADRGSQDQNDAAWLAYVRAGIAVANIKPSEKVYEQWIAERDRQSAGPVAQPAAGPADEAGEASRNDGRGAPASRVGSRDPGTTSANPRVGGSGDQAEQGEFQPGRLDQGTRQADEKDRSRPPAVVEKAPQLTADQERALWRVLPDLVGRFSARAGGDRARYEIRGTLAGQIQDRLRQERDDTERRRLLLQFAANLIAPARAPEGLDDARNLLARTASQEAIEAAIKAASEQQRPLPAPQPAPGPRPAGPRMNP